MVIDFCTISKMKKVTNELRHLALYLDELIDTGNGLEVGSSLYEQVQYNNSIIPRLYLMITVNGMNEQMCSCSIKFMFDTVLSNTNKSVSQSYKSTSD